MTPNEQTRANGSITAMRVFGVPIRFHFTFILLLVFLVAMGTEGGSGLASAIYVVALFASVVLHELGHALVSRRFGIRTIEILLFPIGGLARLERNPAPREELWIAVAGPVVNIVLCGVLEAILYFWTGSVRWYATGKLTESSLLASIATGNLALAAFNFLPAFPMDGGRMLRAFLALSRPEEEATQIAARAGRWLAFLIGVYGLSTANYILVFIAFFVYLGAVQESAAAMGRALTHGVPVRAAMITEFHTLGHGQTVRDAANLLLATSQQDFPVVHGDQVLGLLGRTGLLRAMADAGPDAYVASVMDRDFAQVRPDLDLSEAVPLLAQSGACALVMDEGKLVGLLTSENLTEFLLLKRFERMKQ